MCFKMANKPIAKVPVLGKALEQDIKDHNLSIREVAKQIGYIRARQIRYYIKRNEMPEKLLDDIQQIIEPRTKTIWMRIGVSVPVTDNELLYLMKVSRQYAEDYGSVEKFKDVDISEYAATQFMKRAKADGESYIPSVCFDAYEDWYNEMIKKECNV